MKSISIVSLGWLGSQLYHELSNRGFITYGTYHNSKKDLKNELYLDFHTGRMPNELLESDILIFNLTPSTIQSLIKFELFFKEYKNKIIFVSSTSVYGQNGILTESDVPIPRTKNGQLLRECELYLLKRRNSIIIRPAGLYDSKKHPGSFLSGKSNIVSPNSPVNLISIEDLTSIILLSVEDSDKKIINAVNSHHPERKKYYTDFCLQKKLPLPFFSDEIKNNKTIETQYDKYKIDTPLL